MSVNKLNIKMNPLGHSFIKNIKFNYGGIYHESISLPESLDLVAKFFKNNNDIYVQMLKTKVDGKEQ